MILAIFNILLAYLLLPGAIENAYLSNDALPADVGEMP